MSATFVALLRGVNVSGQKRIVMADLTNTLEASGLANVRTYLQSGNVVFDAENADAAEHAAAIHERIARDLGHDVAVLVLPSTEMQQVASSNPFSSAEVDEKSLHVTFLFRQISSADFAHLELRAAEGERAESLGRAVYLCLPRGYGRTRLNNAFFEKALAMPATTRNWRTVLALARLSAEK